MHGIESNEAPCGVEGLLTSRVEQEQQAGDGWTQAKRTAVLNLSTMVDKNRDQAVQAARLLPLLK